MSARMVLAGGYLLTMDKTVTDGIGDVLIENGRIAAVGRLGHVADADTIDAAGRIVMPGLIDSHRHLWQAALRGIAADWTLDRYLSTVVGVFAPAYTPDDVYAGDLLGMREAVAEGVTTVLDFNQVMNSPEHADAALAALGETGARALYAPSLPRTAAPPDDAERSRLAAELNRLRSATSGLVTLALGARSAEISTAGHAIADVRLGREAGIRLFAHVGVGARGRAAPSIAQLAATGLLGPDMTFIHCCTSSDEELRQLAGAGAAATVSPRVEMLMGHGYPATGRLHDAGVTTGLSIDVATGVTGSVLAEMRATLEAETLRRNVLNIDAGGSPPEHALTAADMLRMATIDNARVLGIDAVTGSLTPGKQADIVVLDIDTPGLSPVNNWEATATLCTAANVEHVFVAGRPLKRDFALVGADRARERALGEQSRDRILRAAGWETAA